MALLYDDDEIGQVNEGARVLIHQIQISSHKE